MLIQEMSHEECFAALAKTRLGRLGCALENQPYVVPIYFAFDRSEHGEPYLYGFTTPGQKIEWMRANPLVCVELDEVTSFDQWMSVIVFGRYEELPDVSDEAQELLVTRAPARATLPRYTPENEPERRRAHDMLQEYAVWWQPGYAAYLGRASHDKKESYKIVYYRISIDRVTGHRATPRKIPEKAASSASA